ncbi:hypothetical protein [Vibrio sp. AND4]|uniref:hypothetical protein n=1 Tax=Vibrio sp. AND4 TaxID=314289 RepID=UPI00015EFA2C|nr:hypothetical protein [Vibrio sp. AND4]EDP60130.1 hypothetical protein AND4_01938 [Vibrio sp. AND4]
MKKYLFSLCMILFLTSCKKGEQLENDIPLVPREVEISLESLQQKALIGVEQQVTIKASVQGSVPLKLTSVTPSGPVKGCKVSKMQGMTFSVYADDIRECRFESTVEPVDSLRYKGQAKAMSRIAVSETASNYALPNLSITGDLSQSEIVINLNDELKPQFDTSGYTLDENATASDRSWLDVNTLSNSITYTPSASGAVQIMYSMSNGTEIKLGTIYLAISDQPNSNPMVDSFDYDKLLKKNTEYKIELDGHITDNEKAPKLVDVIAYNANISNISADNYTFDFKSSTPGRHEVAFIVEDEQGGYGVGQVVINVEPEFDIIQDWSDITITDPESKEDITFTAPLSKEVADYANVAYQSAIISSPSYGPSKPVVTMDWHQAQSYCSTRKGRLPTLRELEVLKSREDDVFKLDNWPEELPFWSVIKDSKDSANVILLRNGTEDPSADIKSEELVTCVYLDENVRDFEITKSERDDDFSDYDKQRGITTTLKDPDGNDAAFQDVKFWSYKEQGGFGDDHFNETTAMTAKDGLASVTYEFTTGEDDIVMSGYNDSVALTQINVKPPEYQSLSVRGARSINVGFDDGSVSETYTLYGVKFDGFGGIIENSLIRWSADIRPERLADFDKNTGVLTTNPQWDNTDGSATITGCSGGVCAKTDVFLQVAPYALSLDVISDNKSTATMKATIRYVDGNNPGGDRLGLFWSSDSKCYINGTLTQEVNPKNLYTDNNGIINFEITRSDKSSGDCVIHAEARNADAVETVHIKN